MERARPKKKAKATPLTQAEQSARFIEAARNAEADERPAAFDDVFKKIALKRGTRGSR